NYWATPEGTGFSQLNYDISGDGICDSSYSLDSDNIDILPLTANTISSPDYPRTLTVDDSGGADYTSIQAAVDAAFPGESILVSPGSYNENIDVGKQLTITSADGASATNVIAVSADDNVFEVTANSVTISGFSINGAGSETEDNAAIFLNSDNNIITDNIVSDTEFGICAYYSDDNEINENSMQNSNILLYSASSNVLSDNTVSKGMIILSAGGNNVLSGNVVDGGNYGINLHSSTENTINDNVLTGNSAVAVVLDGADSNTLSGNTLSGGEYGIEMMASSCVLTGNTISDNDYGISMRYSDNNVIYNNIFDNDANIVIETTNRGNLWNTEQTAGLNIIGGAYLGGNYWATPEGTGFSQINYDSDGDGICESTYVMDSDNVDYLPLTPNEASKSGTNSNHRFSNS
ncbi:MAG: NosD domain-containing protein, partial [Methanolobus sp.]